MMDQILAMPLEFKIAASVALIFFCTSWLLLAIRRGLAMQLHLLLSFLACLLFCRLPMSTELTHVSGTIFFYFVVWIFQVKRFMKLMARDQIRKEWKFYLAECEIVPADPYEYAWLNLDFYDEKQRELESLGLTKVRDFEILAFTQAFPEMRNFARGFVNAEHDITSSIMQTKFVKPKTLFERLVDTRIISFGSEFSDGSFLETNNAKGLNPMDKIEGVVMQQFLPDTPLSEMLDAHEAEIEAICQRKGVDVIYHRTESDMIASDVRMHAVLRLDRQKKGGFTPGELSKIVDDPTDEGTKMFMAEYTKQAQKIARREQKKQDDEF